MGPGRTCPPRVLPENADPVLRQLFTHAFQTILKANSEALLCIT